MRRRTSAGPDLARDAGCFDRCNHSPCCCAINGERLLAEHGDAAPLGKGARLVGIGVVDGDDLVVDGTTIQEEAVRAADESGTEEADRERHRSGR